MNARMMALAAAAALAAIPAGRAQAQDIEAQAHLRGVRLPAGYYERIRQDPDFFELKRGWMHRAQAAAAPGVSPAVLPAQGELRMVVVMTLFSDSPEPPVSTDVIQQQLFGANPLGNLTEFYDEISGGRVNLTGNVLPWVRSGTTRQRAVGTSYGLGADAELGEHLMDAVARLDATVDFGQYDNDGPDGVPNSADDDGYVDVTVFQFSEIAASCGGNGVWPHRSSLRGWNGGMPVNTNDLRPNGQRVRVDDYIIQSAVDCEGDPQNIATIAHETGHAFGLPDFYDATLGILPQQRRWVLGCWTLMAAGAWGCGDGSTAGKVAVPTHMGAYEKLELGWIGRMTAEPGWRREYTLLPVAAGGTVLQVPLNGEHEYLLLEYRPATGFDAGLPASGVIVYHVEPNRPLRPCQTCPRLYKVGLVEADADSGLVRTAQQGGNRGVPGDAFTGTRALTDNTVPSLRLNSGMRAGVAVEIAVSGGQARVLVSTLPTVLRTPLLAPFLAAGTAPTQQEQTALDTFGNRNGRYDVGDLRSYVLTRPGALNGG